MHGCPNADDYYAFKKKAELQAAEAGWEGDPKRGAEWPLCRASPGQLRRCSVHYMIAWKQDNNGTTFVASPFPLPWLE